MAPSRKAAKRPPHRSKGRRLTIEQQQEYRSRGQFDDRFSEYGWVVNPRERDHGEDLSIDIYDDGHSAGLSFLAQLKSTDDVERFVPKKDKTKLSYRLEVDDLRHWAVAAHLIVVVVWDVTLRSGAWLTVRDILKQVRRTARLWRSQKTVTVAFPRANGTDDASLSKLRHLVADHNAPIVRKGKITRVTGAFSFPASKQGRAAAAALRQALDIGDPARIEGKYIKQWKMPDWWERLYGKTLPEHVTFGAATSTTDIPTRIEVDTPSGVHVLDLDLRQQQAGRKGFVVGSDARSASVALKVTALREGEGARLNMNLKVQHIVEDIFDARRATELLIALRTGTRLRVVLRRTNDILMDTPVPDGFTECALEDLVEWRGFLDKLCFIQGRVRKLGVIRIPKRGVKRKDAAPCERLYEIARTGQIRRELTFSGEIDLTKKGASSWREIIAGVKRGEPLEVGVDVGDAGTIDALNVKVPLGRLKVRHDASGIAAQVEAALAAGKPCVRFSVADVQVIEEYLDWMPGADNGSRCAEPSKVGSAPSAAAPSPARREARASRSSHAGTKKG